MSDRRQIPDLVAMRRKDRVMGADWIRSFLYRAPFASIGSAVDGQPFVNTNTFVYDAGEHAIFLHTARQGRLRTIAENTAPVCFMAAEMGRLLPADVAKEFSVEFASVVVYGTLSIVRDEASAARALQLLLDKYFPHLLPGEDYQRATAKEIAMTTAFRIDIDQWNGKCKREADDFPGASYYGQSPDR